MTTEEQKEAAVEAVMRTAKLLSASMSEMEHDDFYDALWKAMRRELPKHWDNDE